MQLVAAVLMKEPRWPSETRPDVPRALEAILRRAMAKKPENRFANAIELGVALERFARGEESGVESPRRRAALLLVAGAALVAIVAALTAARSGPTADGPVSPPLAPVASSTASPTHPRAPSLPPRVTPTPAKFREVCRSLARGDTRDDPARKPLEAAIAAVRSGGPLMRVPTSEKGVVHVCFLSDRWLAFLFASELHVLDLETGAQAMLWRTDFTSDVLSVGPLEPDGKRKIAVGTAGGIYAGRIDPAATSTKTILDGGGFALMPWLRNASIKTITFAPDGLTVAVGVAVGTDPPTRTYAELG